MVEAHPCSPSRLVGFTSQIGENNCFLNSALQILYCISSFHLDSFNEALVRYCSRNVAEYTAEGATLIYHLVWLHYKYYFEKEGELNPNELRAELAKNDLFPLKERSDSAEALNYILMKLHQTMVPAGEIDTENAYCGQSCPAHSCFKLELIEQTSCRCGASSEPKAWDYCSFFFPIHIDQVLIAASQNFSTWIQYIGRLQDCYNGGQFLGECLAVSPSCHTSKKEYQLLTAPEVLLLSLLSEWDSLVLQGKKVMQILSLFPGIMPITTLFPQSQEREKKYRLRSWIAFGLGHYVAYIRQSDEELWYKYNDAKVTMLSTGSYFSCVKDMMENNFHPVAMCYEKLNGEAGPVRLYYEIELWRDVETLVHNIELRNGLINDPLPKPDGWTCCVCTFRNDKARTICEICQTAKPTSTPSPKHRTQPNLQRAVSTSASIEPSKPFSGGSGYQSLGSASPWSASVSPARSLPTQSPPKSNTMRCPKCSRAYPPHSNCECTVLSYLHSGGKLICASCSLMNEPSNKNCGNCGKILRLSGFNCLCTTCRGQIKDEGYCKNCNVRIRVNPCLHCGNEHVSCLCAEGVNQ